MQLQPLDNLQLGNHGDYSPAIERLILYVSLREKRIEVGKNILATGVCKENDVTCFFPPNSNCALETKQGNMEILWRTKVECEKKAISLHRMRISIIRLSTSASGR